MLELRSHENRFPEKRDLESTRTGILQNFPSMPWEEDESPGQQQAIVKENSSKSGRRRTRVLPYLFLLILAGCGGGGSGGTGGNPLEIAYVLSEDTGNGNEGYVLEYGLNPASNQFQMSGTGPIPTQGQTPIQFLTNNQKTLAFVLNNGSTSSNGSVAVYSVGANGLATTPTLTKTGQNPVNMALDPGGNYLVVANHGNGMSSGSGSVEVFSLGPSGNLSPLPKTGSPCSYPFRVVFPKGATGSPSDTVYIACTSPELLGSSSPPSASIYPCTIQELTESSCTSIAQYNSTPAAFMNFVIDPTNTYVVAPGTTSSQSGFVLVCTISGNDLKCPISVSPISSPWIPSGNIAFGGTSSSPTVYIGNYDASSLSQNFASCSISGTPKCTATYSTNKPGPIYLATQGSVLYIADTVTAINGSYTASGTTSGASPPPNGYLYACPTSSLSCSAPSSTSSSGNTGGWPVGVFFDNRDMVFVPALAGEVDIFTGASTGNLAPFQILQTTYSPLSVTIP
jgi:hypothetical protein